MAWSKAVKYGLAALSGTAQGLATSALAEDEVRQKQSSDLFKLGVTKAEKNQEEINLNVEAIKTENDVVNQLKGTSVNGKIITEAQARALHRVAKRQNKDALEIIGLYNVSGEGTVIPAQSKELSVIPTGLGEAEDEGGFMQKGRNKAVVTESARLLKSAGIDVEMSTPQLPTVEGVQVTPIEDVDISVSSQYVIGKDGVPINQVLAVTKTNPRTNVVTVEYKDKVTGEKYVPEEGQRISSAADAFKVDQAFNDYGPLFVLGEDDQPDYIRNESGQKISGYLMKNGEIRLQKGGKISDTVYKHPEERAVLIAGKHYADAVASGDMNELNRLFKVKPIADFYSLLPTMDTQYQANNLLLRRSQRRLDLHEKYGNSMYGFEGGFATMITGLSKNARGIGNIIVGLTGLEFGENATLDEKRETTIRYLESDNNIGLLRAFADRQEELMSQDFLSKQEEVAMAKVLDAAIATVTAYDLAKQTGDTRISNQDFDSYMRTVSGNNAKQTINLIKEGLGNMLNIYSSQYDNLKKARARIPTDERLSAYQASFDTAFDTVTPVETYRARVKTMFKPFEEKKETKPVEEADFTTDVQDDGSVIVQMKDGTQYKLGPRHQNSSKADIATAIDKMKSAQQGN